MTVQYTFCIKTRFFARLLCCMYYCCVFSLFGIWLVRLSMILSLPLSDISCCYIANQFHPDMHGVRMFFLQKQRALMLASAYICEIYFCVMHFCGFS